MINTHRSIVFSANLVHRHSCGAFALISDWHNRCGVIAKVLIFDQDSRIEIHPECGGNRYIFPYRIALRNGFLRPLPPDATYNEMRKSLMHQLTKSLRNNREQWWIGECTEIEKAASIANKCKLSTD